MHIQGMRIFNRPSERGHPPPLSERGLTLDLHRSAVFCTRGQSAPFEESRPDAGELSLRVAPASQQVTVSVAGRVTVSSSPQLRCALLGLLRRGAPPLVVIDVSAVSYLDMSGIATLLEALKAAHEHSVNLCITGLSGQVRTLAEIAQLDTIFRAWGSEVEFR